MRPSYTIQILHISDLHARNVREEEQWRRHLVLDSFLNDIKSLGSELGIDLICFTGDLADWGTADEYVVAAEFLEKLLVVLALPKERLFIVPGNHDIERPASKAIWQKLRQAFTEHDPLAMSRFFAGVGRHPPAGLAPQDLQDLLSRQTHYRAFLERFGLRKLLPAASPHGLLGFRKTLRLANQPFDLHVIGLDSAFLAGDDSDAGKLRLTEDQVMRLCTNDGHALAGLRLALIHHPLTELADGAECQSLLAERVDLLLRGHLHNAEPSLWSDPDRRLYQLAAGCLYEGHRADKYPNGYFIETLTLDEAGKLRDIKVRFRCRSPNGVWHNDASRYRNAPDGQLRISVPYDWQLPTPATRWDPKRGPTPAYLDEDHRALGEALSAAQETLERLIIGGEDATAAREAVKAIKQELRNRPHLREGDLLSDGRFKLISELGKGGFGVVWKAYDRRQRDFVALKILHSQWSRDASHLERFARGARSMAALHHPQIVRVLDPDLHDELHIGFVMEYLSGGDLHGALRKQPIPLEHTLRIAQEIGSALAFAHARGIVHRDLKPANILLDGTGRAYLTDFDLVWDDASTGGTRSGIGLGTFLYTAPELQNDARHPTPSADVYSLAMSVVAALRGAPPTLDMIKNVEPFIEQLAIPSTAKKVLSRALKWNQEERIASMEAFSAELTAAVIQKQALPAAPAARADLIPFSYLGIFDDSDYSRVKLRGWQFAPDSLDALYRSDASMRWLVRLKPGTILHLTLFVCQSELHARVICAALRENGLRAEPMFFNPGYQDEQFKSAAAQLDAICVVGFPHPSIASHPFRQIILLDTRIPPVLFLERYAKVHPQPQDLLVNIIDLYGNHPVFVRRLEVMLSLAQPPISVRAFLESSAPLKLPSGSTIQIDQSTREALTRPLGAQLAGPLTENRFSLV